MPEARASHKQFKSLKEILIVEGFKIPHPSSKSLVKAFFCLATSSPGPIKTVLTSLSWQFTSESDRRHREWHKQKEDASVDNILIQSEAPVRMNSSSLLAWNVDTNYWFTFLCLSAIDWFLIFSFFHFLWHFMDPLYTWHLTQVKFLLYDFSIWHFLLSLFKREDIFSKSQIRAVKLRF